MSIAARTRARAAICGTTLRGGQGGPARADDVMRCERHGKRLRGVTRAFDGEAAPVRMRRARPEILGGGRSPSWYFVGNRIRREPLHERFRDSGDSSHWLYSTASEPFPPHLHRFGGPSRALSTAFAGRPMLRAAAHGGCRSNGWPSSSAHSMELLMLRCVRDGSARRPARLLMRLRVGAGEAAGRRHCRRR